MPKYRYPQNGFTLIEIMIVIITLGILAAYAIPSYRKAIIKGYEKQLIQTSHDVFSAEALYRNQNKNTATNLYWVPSSGVGAVTAAQINDGLALNIIADSRITFDYATSGDKFVLELTYNQGQSGEFTVQVSKEDGVYDALKDSQPKMNPCCKIGSSCPSLLTCYR